MKFSKLLNIAALLSIACSGSLTFSCKSDEVKSMIILTEAPVNSAEINYLTGENWRYISQSRIVAINPEKPSDPPQILSGNYFSARVSEISYDGKSMLFAAQTKQGDPWQIYEMKLSDKKTHQIISLPENCIDPAYLPGDRTIFSRSLNKDSIGAGHALYSCKIDGSDLKRISFHPNSDLATSTMADGRIITLTQQLKPELSGPVLLVLRPDGTKSDVFYFPPKGCNLFSRPQESRTGKLLFVETRENNPNSGNIISVDQDRPLHSRINLTEAIDGSFKSITHGLKGKYLVSYKSAEATSYSLCEFDLQAKTVSKAIISDPKYNILEAVIVDAHERPKKLPSEVDSKVKTGLIMCQDVNVGEEASGNKYSVRPKTESIEILGLSASLGVVPVEADGSFYLKVIADKPFRIQALDVKGNVIGKPCTWIWMMPNERRGCVGCHENHDLVPENKAPLSVKKAPVAIPVHIKGIKEKQVTLE